MIDVPFLSNTSSSTSNITFTRENGSTLVDKTGKQYINFSSSTLNIARQYKSGTSHTTNGTIQPSYVEFAQLLTGAAPTNITVSYFNFHDTIPFAVHLAQAHTRRRKILSVRRCLLSTSSDDVLYSEEQTLSSLVKLISDHPDSAAVIVDPLGAFIGLYEPNSIGKYLSLIQKLCNESGIVFIVDETQTFGGYIGTDIFVCNHFSLSPDIICIGRCYGIYCSVTLCSDNFKSLMDRAEDIYDGQNIVSAEAILAVKTFVTNKESLDEVVKATQDLINEFPMLSIRQVGYFVFITRKSGEFIENWTKRIHELSLEGGLLVKINNIKSGIILSPSFGISLEVIKTGFSKLSSALRQAEIELAQPSYLFGDLIKNGITPTLLTRIKKRPPVASQWEYVGALLAEIDNTLFVRKIDAHEQVRLIQGLRSAGIPAAEVVVTPKGCPEYAYLPGVSMEAFMVDCVGTDPGLVNGLVLRHQRYLEMSHDAGLCIPDRWPGNTIIYNNELSLIDFDLVYCESTGNNSLLFAFEEVCSTFQCVSWVKSPVLQQDISDRLCLAVISRNKLQLVSLVWKGMVKFYGNPLKPFLPESLTPDDYKMGIDAMNRSFAKLNFVLN